MQFILNEEDTVSSSGVCGTRNLLYEICPNIFSLILELDTFGYSDTILCDFWAAVTLINNYIATLISFTTMRKKQELWISYSPLLSSNSRRRTCKHLKENCSSSFHHYKFLRSEQVSNWSRRKTANVKMTNQVQYLWSHCHFNGFSNLRDTLQHSCTSPNPKIDILRRIISAARDPATYLQIQRKPNFILENQYISQKTKPINFNNHISCLIHRSTTKNITNHIHFFIARNARANQRIVLKHIKREGKFKVRWTSLN